MYQAAEEIINGDQTRRVSVVDGLDAPRPLTVNRYHCYNTPEFRK